MWWDGRFGVLWSVPYSAVKGRQMEGGCRTYSAVRVPPWYVVAGALKLMTSASFAVSPPSSVCPFRVQEDSVREPLFPWRG